MAHGPSSKSSDDSMHPAWWVVLIAVPIIAIVVGVMVFNRKPKSEQTPDATNQTPAAAPTPAVLPQPQPLPPAIAAPTPLPEVTPAQPTVSPPVVTQPSPDPIALLASLDTFLKKLCSQMEKDEAEGHVTNEKGFNDKITTEVLTSDIKKSDSLVFPVVGVATVRTEIEGRLGSGYLISKIYSITMGQVQGKWKVSKATMRAQSLHDTADGAEQQATQYLQKLVDKIPQ